MTTEEKDQQLGRVIREIGEHERDIRSPLVSIQRTADRLRCAADTLDAAYGGMLQDGLWGGANTSGPTSCQSFADVLNVEAISKLENEVRRHSHALTRLYSQQKNLV